MAITEKVAVCPAATVWFMGCVVMDGATGGVELGVKVHVVMSWMAVRPPVPPVNPTYARLPVRAGMLIALESVKLFPVVESVMVQIRVVPS